MSKKWFLALGLVVSVLVGLMGIRGVLSGAEENSVVTGQPKETRVGYASGEVLVRFKGGPAPLTASSPEHFRTLQGAEVERYAAALPEEARLVLQQIQGRVARAHPHLGLVKVKLPEDASVGQAIEALYRSGAVEYAEPNYHVYPQAVIMPNDTRFGEQWGFNNTGQVIGGQLGTPNADIDGPEAWNVATSGAQTVVALLDTGVDFNHEDLGANMWTNTTHTPKEIAGNGIDDDGNGWVDDYYGINAWDNNGNPLDTDNYSHGTNCAGVIGAVGNNGKGVCGVNWTAQIMALKFMNGGLPPYGLIEDAITCINYALAMKVRDGYPRMVMNASWGNYVYSQFLYEAIDAARLAGVLFVAAAGDDNRNGEMYPFYPASYNLDNIISVGASDNRDEKWGGASTTPGSNYGLAKVDLFAPGRGILTTKRSNAYEYKDGTSLACAQVSGAVALIWSHYAASALTYQQVKGMILNGVDDGQGARFGLYCRTEGRLNLRKSLDPALITTPAVLAVTPAWGNTGETVTLTGTNFGAAQGTLEFQGMAFPPANITSWADDEIVATIPATLPIGYGKLKVTEATGTATSRGAAFGKMTMERRAGTARRPGQIFAPRGLVASAQVGNNVWVMGGRTSWGQTGLVEKYALATNRTTVDSAWMMDTAVSHAGAAVIGTGTSARIYVVGGTNIETNQIYSTLQIFNPTTGTWTYGKSMPQPLKGPAAISHQSKLYVFGGRDKIGNIVKTTYVYTPGTNTWETKTNMPIATYNAAVAKYGTSRIWVMGGGDTGAPKNDVQEYNPVADTWSPKPHLNYARTGSVGVSSGTKVFCLHGDAHSESERYAAAAWQAEIFGWQQLYAPGLGKYLTQIYVLGGQLKSSGECSNIVWAFPMPQ